MNNLKIGEWDDCHGRPFAYYETIGGGIGAGPQCDGASGCHSHMTNTLNTPVEALEYAYPFRIASYALREGSGGNGQHQGGDGLVRAYEFLQPAEITLLSDRRVTKPYGLEGGEAGKSGRNRIRLNGVEKDLSGKCSFPGKQEMPLSSKLLATTGRATLIPALEEWYDSLILDDSAGYARELF